MKIFVDGLPLREAAVVWGVSEDEILAAMEASSVHMPTPDPVPERWRPNVGDTLTGRFLRIEDRQTEWGMRQRVLVENGHGEWYTYLTATLGPALRKLDLRPGELLRITRLPDLPGDRMHRYDAQVDRTRKEGN